MTEQIADKDGTLLSRMAGILKCEASQESVLKAISPIKSPGIIEAVKMALEKAAGPSVMERDITRRRADAGMKD